MSENNNDHIFLGTNYQGEDDSPIPSPAEVYQLERIAYENGVMDGWAASCD